MSSSVFSAPPLSWPHYPETAYPTERRRIRDAFGLFDRDNKKVVLREEIGTIMRYLGQYPTENELVTQILPSLSPLSSPSPLVPLSTFLPFMLHATLSHTYDPDPEPILLAAFEALDPDKKGYIDESSLVEMLSECEFPMREKEIEDFLRVAKDPDTGFIHYHDYIQLLASEQ